MKEINKLVDLVTHGLKSNFDVINLTGDVDNPGKEQLLYNGVLNGDYPTDESAAEGMYQSDIYDQRFRMLKSRLRHKLYDLLYHINFDEPGFSHSAKVELECKEYVHKAHILYRLGEFSMSEKQLNKCITLAEENQITHALVEAYELKSDILSYECKPTDFELTIDKIKSLRKLSTVEKESQDTFLRMRMLMSKSIHSRNTCQDHLSKALVETEKAWKSTKSINIFLNYYQLNVWILMLDENYTGLYKFSQEALKTIVKSKVNVERFDQGYNSYLASRALLSAEKYKEGYAEAKVGFKFIEKSTEQWFDHSETYFLLAMHNQDYKLANTVLDSVLKNPNYSRASEQIVGRWKVFRIYLNFAMPGKEMLKRVRFSDVYEAADYYYVELKGYYLTLPLLEFIHHVNKDRMDLAMAKLEEVDNYFFKNLNEPGKNPREKQFYKMLKVLKASGFDASKTRTKTEKYLEKIREKRTYLPFSDFEIIPYEHLWEVVLQTVAKMKTTAA
ncbi:hypothetical protein N7E81_06005 [Reichenbachiella carrageenanivorans]|uniref:Uncharacterized protein n=1 Tax=Reichenbachiella carrageenanivorans TaxID=2979869 RepID=A0ABY6D3D1_9BACT|nr:hypothetical protein [Reichenbachiella carrageenanivorans]UXX80651.1 hypothetical protein N7E81_06005 [Reichenbachiella carrageenanivorans]